VQRRGWKKDQGTISTSDTPLSAVDAERNKTSYVPKSREPGLFTASPRAKKRPASGGSTSCSDLREKKTSRTRPPSPCRHREVYADSLKRLRVPTKFKGRTQRRDSSPAGPATRAARNTKKKERNKGGLSFAPQGRDRKGGQKNGRGRVERGRSGENRNRIVVASNVSKRDKNIGTCAPAYVRPIRPSSEKIYSLGRY